MTKRREVPCTVEVVDLKGARGPIEGVEVTCSRCGNVATSFGTSDKSVLRCFGILRNGCPRGEDNDYYEAEEE